MSTDKQIIKFETSKDITDFLDQPTLKIAEALTGVLSASLSDLKLSIGKVLQAGVKGRMLSQFGEELRDYAKKGAIKKDYLESAINQHSLCDLFAFVDEENPDEIRFNAMKSIFLASVAYDADSREEQLAYQLMRICRQLESAEIQILKAAYDVVQGRTVRELAGAVSLGEGHSATWRSIIAQQIGHNIPALVETYEPKLIQLVLITDYSRNGEITSSFNPTQTFRLNLLGMKLCQFMTKFK